MQDKEQFVAVCWYVAHNLFVKALFQCFLSSSEVDHFCFWLDDFLSVVAFRQVNILLLEERK